MGVQPRPRLSQVSKGSLGVPYSRYVTLRSLPEQYYSHFFLSWDVEHCAVSSIYIFRELFSSIKNGANRPNITHPETILRLQDYNSSVLQLVTLPNVLLA